MIANAGSVYSSLRTNFSSCCSAVHPLPWCTHVLIDTRAHRRANSGLSQLYIPSTGRPAHSNAPVFMPARAKVASAPPWPAASCSAGAPCTARCTPYHTNTPSPTEDTGQVVRAQDSLLSTPHRVLLVLSGLQPQEPCCFPDGQLSLWKGRQSAASLVTGRGLKTKGASTEGKPASAGGSLPEELLRCLLYPTASLALPTRPSALPRRQRQQS